MLASIIVQRCKMVGSSQTQKTLSDVYVHLATDEIILDIVNVIDGHWPIMSIISLVVKLVRTISNQNINYESQIQRWYVGQANFLALSSHNQVTFKSKRPELAAVLIIITYQVFYLYDYERYLRAELPRSLSQPIYWFLVKYHLFLHVNVNCHNIQVRQLLYQYGLEQLILYFNYLYKSLP